MSHIVLSIIDGLWGMLLILPSLAAHEVAHGYAALWCGDTSVRRSGALSLNPLKHVDPVGTLVLPIALMIFGLPAFGWAKPTPVNFYNTCNPRRAMWVISLAGPLANLVLAVVGVFVMWALFCLGLPFVADYVGRYMVYFNVMLTVLNLLPIPPLDGSRIVAAFLPAPMMQRYLSLERYGMILLLILFYSGSFLSRLIVGLRDALFLLLP